MQLNQPSPSKKEQKKTTSL